LQKYVCKEHNVNLYLLIYLRLLSHRIHRQCCILRLFDPFLPQYSEMIIMLFKYMHVAIKILMQ